MQNPVCVRLSLHLSACLLACLPACLHACLRALSPPNPFLLVPLFVCLSLPPNCLFLSDLSDAITEQLVYGCSASSFLFLPPRVYTCGYPSTPVGSSLFPYAYVYPCLYVSMHIGPSLLLYVSASPWLCLCSSNLFLCLAFASSLCRFLS